MGRQYSGSRSGGSTRVQHSGSCTLHVYAYAYACACLPYRALEAAGIKAAPSGLLRWQHYRSAVMVTQCAARGVLIAQVPGASTAVECQLAPPWQAQPTRDFSLCHWGRVALQGTCRAAGLCAARGHAAMLLPACRCRVACLAPRGQRCAVHNYPPQTELCVGCAGVCCAP